MIPDPTHVLNTYIFRVENTFFDSVIFFLYAQLLYGIFMPSDPCK